MKKVKLFISLGFAIGSLIFIQSCTETDADCPVVDCVNGTQNDDCACDCTSGFEKDSSGICTVAWADNFVGLSLAAFDTCYGDNGPGSFSYNVNISKVSAKEIRFTNFGAFGPSAVVDANLEEVNKLSIDHTDGSGRKFMGTGSMESDKITINYIVTFSDMTSDTCFSTIQK
jgi:hypothetical protein